MSESSKAVTYELPFIQQGDNILISAQLLHRKLNVKTRFYDWIQRRIEKFGFEDNKDIYSNLSKSRTKPSTDYLLTLDTAKELAMLEENEVGRSIRRYFIQKEKELRGISQLPAERSLFAGLRAKKVNDRELFPYVEILRRCGYSTRSSSSHRRARYWMHFVKEGNLLYITREFAMHLHHSRAVINNRRIMANSQPVLPLGFGDVSLLNTGSYGTSH